jgi:hypothetical protein
MSARIDGDIVHLSNKDLRTRQIMATCRTQVFPLVESAAARSARPDYGAVNVD